jgi:hypothetical protein
LCVFEKNKCFENKERERERERERNYKLNEREKLQKKAN